MNEESRVVFLLFFFFVGIHFIYVGACLFAIAAKTNTPGRWMAWVPILQLVLICRIGGIPGALVIVVLAAGFASGGGGMIWLVSQVVFIVLILIMMMQLAKGLGEGNRRFLMIVPLVNLIYLGWLAFRTEPEQHGTNRFDSH